MTINITEPPYTDPYVRWCGRRLVVRSAPIPIFALAGFMQQFTQPLLRRVAVATFVPGHAFGEALNLDRRLLDANQSR